MTTTSPSQTSQERTSGSDPPALDISVVVPMWNEAAAITGCIEGFDNQTLPKERFEVIVVDGGSDDGSRELVDGLASEHPWLRMVDNPARRIPVACNLGVENARGKFVCFFSSHGLPSPTFLENTVRVLTETGAAGVGGRYLHEGTDPTSTAIGLAMASRFGMASPHRFAIERQEVDTISHPAYRTDLIRSIGGFDEAMQRNEDYELNWRIRDQGGVLLFDPAIESVYHPRGSLKALARQFFWYGTYKSRMLRSHPRSLRVRHLVPPAAALALAATPALLTSRRTRRPTLALVVAYALGASAATFEARQQTPDASTLVLMAAFPVMHVSWGVGFLAGFTKIEAL